MESTEKQMVNMAIKINITSDIKFHLSFFMLKADLTNT